MDVKNVVKGVSNFVCGTGTGMIVGNIVNLTTPIGAGILSRICIGCAGFVISCVAGDKVGKEAERMIDEMCDNSEDETVETEQKVVTII